MLGTMLVKSFVKSFVTEGCDRTEIQHALRTVHAIKGMCSIAAADCIRKCNSIEECISFTEVSPTPYVFLTANARIRQLLSFDKKSIVTGGHETNE